MDYLVVDNVQNLKLNTRYIGRGTTATCFKTKDESGSFWIISSSIISLCV